MQHGEHGLAVLLDLGPLVAMARVLDREVMQAELLLHLRELGIGRIEQRHPDEATGLLEVVADFLDLDVGELAAFLIYDAVDQHGGSPVPAITVRRLYRCCEGGEASRSRWGTIARPFAERGSMIVVHHLNNSRSQRVLWLLEELGVPYEIKRYQRDRKTMLAPPELRAVHPLGKSPVVGDGDVTVAESGAIIEYLLERFDPKGKLLPPPGTPERRRYTYWLHFAEGSAMTPLLMKLVAGRIRTAPMPFFAKPIARAIAGQLEASFVTPNLKSQLDYMESELTNRPWFTGKQFSAADIQMSFPLEAAQARGGLDASRPHLVAWLAKIHARPAYQRALERGGPFEIAA